MRAGQELFDSSSRRGYDPDIARQIALKLLEPGPARRRQSLLERSSSDLLDELGERPRAQVVNCARAVRQLQQRLRAVSVPEPDQRPQVEQAVVLDVSDPGHVER